ncbi:rRNA pseudouridine synthase [Coriobacteriia bacterium Es71-Z0120]|uniref:pseudouridine synthase n=1 Tax=Parvivirga hydrogeniphila TaxID=2939460 RepID=UPI002260A859|nr:pseudouridine synthase [Parvivirga hydrogeniphila]MCL4079046.1 rRNA pseudouridine synthase [Parvivirga hydrogeniphila]
MTTKSPTRSDIVGDDGSLRAERLQKFLSRAGVASRRAAEEMIAAGRVRVNGEVVTAMGVKVVPEVDVVEVDGVVVAPPQTHLYLMLNKPAGYVTTLKDPLGRPIVADLLPDLGRRVFPVGRLDAETTGLLLLTDDGEFAQMLMHPRFHVPKTYLARVEGHPSERSLQKLRDGVVLADGPTRPADVTLLELREGSAIVRITIREGRKRQVRRMFRHVGHPVIDLHRERIGPVALGDLPAGATRALEPHEVAALMSAAETGA